MVFNKRAADEVGVLFPVTEDLMSGCMNEGIVPARGRLTVAGETTLADEDEAGVSVAELGVEYVGLGLRKFKEGED